MREKSREASPFWKEYVPAEQAQAVRWRTESDYTLKFHEDSILTSSKPVQAFLLLSISLSTSKVTGLRRCRFWGLSGSLMRPQNLHFNKPCSRILRYCQLRTPSTPPPIGKFKFGLPSATSKDLASILLLPGEPEWSLHGP